MSDRSRRLRSPLAAVLGFAASGAVAAWYLRFSDAGLIAWAAFILVGLLLAAMISRTPS